MTRPVYIGGFGNGKSLAKGVGEALGAEDVFTFSYAMDNPVEIAKTIRGAKLYLHSAAINAVRGTKPAEITAVAAPLPTSAARLVMRTGVKSARMAGHGFTSFDAAKTVNKYNASALSELASHPVGNLKHLKEIARTNSIELAGAAQDAGILVQMYFMDRDDYGFIPNDEQRAFANALGVELHMIEGRHDQLPLYPAQTLEAMNAAK